MNDFTKEELKWIYEAMENMMDADSCEPERILMKVKSMIDNYCEHERCGDGAGLEQVCFKCNKSSNEGWA